MGEKILQYDDKMKYLMGLLLVKKSKSVTPAQYQRDQSDILSDDSEMSLMSEVLNSMINDMIATKLSVTDMASYGYISDYMSSINDDYASSVYDGIFDSISDMGSIDDEIDIKVFKSNKNKNGEVTEEQPADKTTKPKATEKAAKKPAAAKTPAAESEYTGIYDYYSNINDKIQIKVYKDQAQNGEGDEMNSISYNPSYQNNMAYSIGDYNANPYSNIYSYGSIEGEASTEGGMFSNLETHHWGIGIAGIATILVTLIYFLMFRKNAKFSHLMPRGRKKVSYDALSDEDDDESEYTYDEETPSLPAKDF